MISSIGNHAYVLDEDGEQTTYLYQKGELSEITNSHKSLHYSTSPETLNKSSPYRF